MYCSVLGPPGNKTFVTGPITSSYLHPKKPKSVSMQKNLSLQPCEEAVITYEVVKIPLFHSSGRLIN
jgi:hypothetical protein